MPTSLTRTPEVIDDDDGDRADDSDCGLIIIGT